MLEFFSVGRGRIWQVCKEKGTVRNVWEGLEKNRNQAEWHPWEKISCALFCVILFFTETQKYMHMNVHIYSHKTAWYDNGLLYWNFWIFMTFVTSIVNQHTLFFFPHGTTRYKETLFYRSRYPLILQYLYRMSKNTTICLKKNEVPKFTAPYKASANIQTGVNELHQNDALHILPWESLSVFTRQN